MIYRYHCTKTKNLESIMRNGLTHSKCTYDPDSNHGTNIFFSDSIAGALVLSGAAWIFKYSLDTITNYVKFARRVYEQTGGTNHFYYFVDYSVIEFSFPDDTSFCTERLSHDPMLGPKEWYECTVPAPIFLTGKERILRYYFEVTLELEIHQKLYDPSDELPDVLARMTEAQVNWWT